MSQISHIVCKQINDHYFYAISHFRWQNILKMCRVHNSVFSSPKSTGRDSTWFCWIWSGEVEPVASQVGDVFGQAFSVVLHLSALLSCLLFGNALGVIMDSDFRHKNARREVVSSFLYLFFYEARKICGENVFTPSKWMKKKASEMRERAYISFGIVFRCIFNLMQCCVNSKITLEKKSNSFYVMLSIVRCALFTFAAGTSLISKSCLFSLCIFISLFSLCAE